MNTRIYVDIETTGFSQKKDKVTEIALVAVAQGLFGKPSYQSLVNPGVGILKGKPDGHVFKPSGISVGELKRAPDAKSVCKEVKEFIQNFVINVNAGTSEPRLFSFNAPFEMRFLTKMPWSIEKKWWAPCVMQRAKKLMGKKRNPNLRDAARHFGVRLEASHRAMPDAVLLQKLHERMLRHGNVIL